MLVNENSHYQIIDSVIIYGPIVSFVIQIYDIKQSTALSSACDSGSVKIVDSLLKNILEIMLEKIILTRNNNFNVCMFD